MPKLIAECHYDIGGGRKVYQDRVSTRRLTTGAGLNLVVALVADGGGGENASERAAAAAHDGFISYLEKSRETVIPSLLTNAVQYANKAVCLLQKVARGAITTTLTAAVVDENSARLFIANVGDSRVYLCRNHKLTQLSHDHSFANEMARRGKISEVAARSHPRAGVLVRALGAREQVEADLGFYVGTTDYEEANARGMEGLPLQDEDSVLVCSDGLTRDSPATHQPLIKPEEIIRTLHDKEGKKAAKELISFALGRGPDDNISVAVIQMPDRWRAWRARRPAIIVGASILGLLLVLLLVMNALDSSGAQLASLAHEQTATSARGAEMARFTPTPPLTVTLAATVTPTSTLRPSATLQAPVANQAARVHPGGTVLYVGDAYKAGAQAGQLDIYHSSSVTNGTLYAMPASGLTFDYVNTDKDGLSSFILRLDPGSESFLYTGGYNQGKLIVTALNLTFYIQGCFAIGYNADPAMATASCYSGDCSYSLGTGERLSIAEGSQLSLDALGQAVEAPDTIHEGDVRHWASLLPPDSPAAFCANRLLPAPTLTLTLRSGMTPTPTSSSGQAPPVPPPADTQPPVIPTNTKTPVVLPTNTQQVVQPTNTQQVVQPTNTKTLVPPASTSTLTPLRTPTPTKTPRPTHTPNH